MASVGLRLWAAVSLALYVAFWLELDNAHGAGTSAAIVCQPSLGASLRRALFRMIGTVAGAVAIVVTTACFPRNRIGFLIGLAAHIPWPLLSELAKVASDRFAPVAAGCEYFRWSVRLVTRHRVIRSRKSDARGGWKIALIEKGNPSWIDL